MTCFLVSTRVVYFAHDVHLFTLVLVIFCIWIVVSPITSYILLYNSTLVLSKMDCGNALLYGSTHTDLQQLKKDYVTPYLKELLWLPVRERTTFKILVYVCKCINELALPYLISLLRLTAQHLILPDYFNIIHVQFAASRQILIRYFHQWTTDVELCCHLYQKFAHILDTFKENLKHKLFPSQYYRFFVCGGMCVCVCGGGGVWCVCGGGGGGVLGGGGWVCVGGVGCVCVCVCICCFHDVFWWFLYCWCVSTTLHSWWRSVVIYQMLVCMHVFLLHHSKHNLYIKI